MTVEEALARPHARGCQSSWPGLYGGIAPGMQTNLATWDAELPAKIASHLGGNLCIVSAFAGVFSKSIALRVVATPGARQQTLGGSRPSQTTPFIRISDWRWLGPLLVHWVVCAKKSSLYSPYSLLSRGLPP